MEPLLHLTTRAEWDAAHRAGRYEAPSLRAQGFIHLSRGAQLLLPAERLYAGRTDLVLLVIDPRRLDAEIRDEPGHPDDPASMRFPHLYGALPVDAVVAVLPFAPGPDGRFALPALPELPELE